MNHQREDHDLRTAFDAVRAADRHQAPPFDALWHEAVVQADAVPTRRGARARALTGLAAAAATLVFGIVALRDAPAPAIETDAETLAIAAAIENWKAATDEIGDMTMVDLTSTLPSLEIDSFDHYTLLESATAGGDGQNS